MDVASIVRATAALAFLLAGSVVASNEGRPVRAIRRDGTRTNGHLVLADGTARIVPEGDGEVIGWDGLAAVEMLESDPDPADARVSDGPFRLLLSRDLAISGRLESMDASAIRFRPVGLEPGSPTPSIARSGVVGLRQRLGRAQVLTDGFDALDPSRWRLEGDVAITKEVSRPGKLARLEAGGSSLAHRLGSPIEAGRVDLAFRRDDVEAVGHSALVEFVFEGVEGPESIRAILGWGEAHPGAMSRGGPALVVQPLLVEPGWHQLSLRFGSDRTILAIDGDVLATGAGPGGPLIELRIRTESNSRPTGPEDLALHVDDVDIFRLFAPSASVEFDPRQDELRLIDGDQVWGRLKTGSTQGVLLEVEGRTIPFAWSEVSEIYFRREPGPASVVAGPLVRVEGKDDRGIEGPDRLEGALIELTASRFVLDAPYVGRVTFGWDAIDRLVPLGQGNLLMLDPTAHHLGDQPIPELTPVLPESDRLELEFPLASVPPGKTALRLDVVDVEGDVEGGRFTDAIRRGELVTEVVLNGKSLGTLNERVKTSNKAPERLRIEIPEGLLLAGPNRLELVQKGRADEPTYRDDLGILGIALEW